MGTTFVLGAGFTRAFVRLAPLLVDDYGFDHLSKRFKNFKHAHRALRDAREPGTTHRGPRARRSSPKKIDLERLLTRLEGMPYDSANARNEFLLLSVEIRKRFVARIERARAALAKAAANRARLSAFAKFVLKNEASIVTFNYDDILDQELYRAPRERQEQWHPDTRYGFYCRHSRAIVAESPNSPQAAHKSLLLKLHGSVNWRSRLGESRVRGPGALLHHESWLTDAVYTSDPEAIEAHLETEPFMVPPVLAKTELHQHPVLGVVWRTAYDKLRAADRVVFIGYSMPTTDLAARTLFSEAIDSRKDLLIVGYTKDGEPNESLANSYRSLFNGIRDEQFDFRGARARIEEEFSSPP